MGFGPGGGAGVSSVETLAVIQQQSAAAIAAGGLYFTLAAAEVSSGEALLWDVWLGGDIAPTQLEFLINGSNAGQINLAGNANQLHATLMIVPTSPTVVLRGMWSNLPLNAQGAITAVPTSAYGASPYVLSLRTSNAQIATDRAVFGYIQRLRAL